MPRTSLRLLVAALGTLLLVAVGTAAAAPPKVTGTVGPGHTIDLRLGGKKVTKLKAGVAYRFVVTDRSEDHDFRLVGPGLDRVLTGEEFVGTRSFTLKLRPGAFRFYCAPHADEMRGGFRVVR